jgi:hypothetical protein
MAAVVTRTRLNVVLHEYYLSSCTPNKGYYFTVGHDHLIKHDFVLKNVTNQPIILPCVEWATDDIVTEMSRAMIAYPVAHLVKKLSAFSGTRTFLTWVVNVTPRPLYPRERDPVPFL